MKLLQYVRPSLVLLTLLASAFAAQARVVTYNNSPADKEQYIIGLLKLAVEKSGDPNIELKPSPDELTDIKFKQEVVSGSMGVYWGPAVNEHVEDLKPIYIPLVKGLLGYRLFIINRDDQSKFDAVDSMRDLKGLIAGQGRTWGDTKILKKAGIPLETSVKYDNLFFMLEGGRFDYFPRGAHEPWAEVTTYPELDLTVEDNLMLVYPLAMIFYVNKSDTELATALENGLEKAIADGSFDEYFYGNTLVQSALSQGNLKSRKSFNVSNPYLPDGMPLDRSELWLDLAAVP